jgi:hypothetical protein
MDILILILKILAYGLIAYFISAIVHELGHVLMGIINGWKFYMLVIGPFELKRENPEDKVKLRFEKNVMMWGGMGGSYPTEDRPENLKIWSSVLMAGPIASLLLGTIVLPLAVFTKSLFLLMLSVEALVLGIICGLPIPMKTGFLYTDGGRWNRLRKGGQEGAEETALFSVVISSVTHGDGVTPFNETIQPLLCSKEASFQYYGQYYLYQIAKEQNDTEKMAEIKDKMEILKANVPQLIIDDCKLS